MANELESVYPGTERKYKVTVTAEQPMEKLDLRFDIICGRLKVTKTGENLIRNDTGGEINYYLVIDTTPFTRGGLLSVVTYVGVPAGDDPKTGDELLTEVHRTDLFNVIPVV